MFRKVLVFLSFISLGFCYQLSVLQNARIIGGHYATLGQFPYQIALMYDKDHMCGGAIIAPNVIITAAHCTYELDPNHMFVIAGSTDLAKHNNVKISVSRFLTHPLYELKKERNGYDISLIFLSESLKFSDTIQPIKLADAYEDLDYNQLATVSGYGKIYKNIETTKLKFADIPIWKPEDCAKYEFYSNRLIFAGHTNGLDNSCTGDSGGPLVQNNKIIGLVSFGYGCGTPRFPKIYTRISTMRSWITERSGI